MRWIANTLVFSPVLGITWVFGRLRQIELAVYLGVNFVNVVELTIFTGKMTMAEIRIELVKWRNSIILNQPSQSRRSLTSILWLEKHEYNHLFLLVRFTGRSGGSMRKPASI